MHQIVRTWIADDQNDRYFGIGPCTLLRNVEETGSLRKAAAAMGMAYSKASRIIHHAEETLGFPLIEGKSGGKAGGGSSLTKEGKHFLECYEAYTHAVSQNAEKMFRKHMKEYLPVRIVIMASGHSRRYGTNKLLEKVDGVSMIRHTLSIIPEEMRKNTIVVTRYPQIEAEAEVLGISVRMHDFPNQSDTIRIGLEGAEYTQGCMFMPADQPWLTEESIRALTANFKEHHEDISRLCWKDKPGAPVVFPVSCYDALRALKGDTGGREVIRSCGLTVHMVQAGSKQELSDIDRPEDLDD